MATQIQLSLLLVRDQQLNFKYAGVAQLARVLPFQGRCCEFETRRPLHYAGLAQRQSERLVSARSRSRNPHPAPLLPGRQNDKRTGYDEMRSLGSQREIYRGILAFNQIFAPLAQLEEHRPFKAGVLGPSPRRRTIFTSAHSSVGLEHGISNPSVEGSNPSGRTNRK